jgi:hypothetical protein
MTTDLISALRSTRDMDEYLEANTAEAIIANIAKELQVARETPLTEVRSDDEVLAVLVEHCGNVPYLATCIYETVTKAGLKLVKNRGWQP